MYMQTFNLPQWINVTLVKNRAFKKKTALAKTHTMALHVGYNNKVAHALFHFGGVHLPNSMPSVACVCIHPRTKCNCWAGPDT